jgi:EAL domain-containing protein (putative c-di-GMP-specific phosphodiesterase class I)
MPNISKNSMNGRNSHWHLVSVGDAKSQAERHPIDVVPFQVGRDHKASLSVNSPCVSQQHAEFLEVLGELYVRDNGSRNGTYVNGEVVAGMQVVRDGDLIQFADTPFRLTHETLRVSQTIGSESCDLALALSQFDQLIDGTDVIVPFLQPVVKADGSAFFAYEALGRSRLYALASPDLMFRTASCLGMEAELSRILRRCGLEALLKENSEAHLFLNTHPKELDEVRSLIASLMALRKVVGRGRVTIEIHESTVTNSETMKLLSMVLKDLGLGLAYDDFGAGQSRLAEMADVPPDFLKFDMSLIRDIHLAPLKRQEMLASLVRMTKDLGAVPLAEGIECAAEAVICRQLGFELFQGYYFGRPMKASKYLNACASTDSEDAPPLCESSSSNNELSLAEN